MKLFKLLLSITLLFVGGVIQAQTNDVVGSAGVSAVDQNPNNVTKLQSQDTRYETVISFNIEDMKLMVYDKDATANNKWKDYSTLLPTVSNTNERLDNPHIVGTDLVFDIIDKLNGDAITGTETISLASIAPVQAVTGGVGIDVTPTGAAFEVVNTLPEATSVTDGNTINFTETGNAITGEIIVDPAGDNAVTTSAAGVKVVVPANLDNDPNNENQTVTGGDGITVTPAGQNFEVISDDASQGEYDNHADAATGGVALGEYFEAAIGNTMGAQAGDKIKRKF